MLTCVTLCCGYICFIPLRKSLYFICFLLVLSAIFPMPHTVPSSSSHSFFCMSCMSWRAMSILFAPSSGGSGRFSITADGGRCSHHGLE